MDPLGPHSPIHWELDQRCSIFMLVNSMHELRYQEKTASGRLWATARNKGVNWRRGWRWKTPLTQLSEGTARAAFLLWITSVELLCGTRSVCAVYLLKPPLWRTTSKDIRGIWPEAFAVASEILDSSSSSTLYSTCGLGQDTRKYPQNGDKRIYPHLYHRLLKRMK